MIAPVTLPRHRVRTEASDARPLPSLASPEPKDFGPALASLYKLLMQDRAHAFSRGQEGAHALSVERDKALERKREAHEREKELSTGRGFFECLWDLSSNALGNAVRLEIETLFHDAGRDLAAMDNPGFWRELEEVAGLSAKVAAVLSALTATAVTFGAAAPAVVLVALALSAAGTAVSETGCFGDASRWVGLGLSAAGTAVSLGGTASMTASTALSQGERVLMAASFSSQAFSGTSRAVGGASHMRSAAFQSDALHAAAEGTRAKHLSDRLSLDAAFLIEALREKDHSKGRAMDTIREAIARFTASQEVAASGGLRG